MPRSFLVKKKAASVPGMPRIIGMECREGHLPPVSHTEDPNTRISLIPPVIFSPAKLCEASSRDDESSTCSTSPSRTHLDSRSPSRGSSHGSVTPEPINYSLTASPHTPLPSPASCSPVSSPSLSPEPHHHHHHRHHQHQHHPQYWAAANNGGAGGISPEMHLPYLALSFKRLQELHIKAVESRLQGITMTTPPTPTSPGSCPASPTSSHSYQPTSPSSPVTTPTVISPVPRLPAGSPIMSSSPVKDRSPSKVTLSPVHHPMATHPPHPHVPHPTPAFPWNQERYPVNTQQERCYPVPMEMEGQMHSQMETPRKRREGEPPRYQCEACNKSYATFSGLSKHKQFHCTALIKKEYSCKHCDKKYVSQGALKMHIRTHTLPCKCHLCGKAFSRPWLLQGHMRTHTGEKPFQCSHCGRSFADRSNLRAHLQTHTDIKKYNCHVCSKSFSRNSLLQKHQEGGCGNAPLCHRSL